MSAEPIMPLPPATSLELGPTSSVVIPLEHHDEFYGLPQKEQARVLKLMRVCAGITGSELSRGRAIKYAATAYGFGESTIENLYYAYNKSGDWRVFARNFKGPKRVSSAFEDEVKRRMLGNCRSMAQAIISIQDDWRDGLPIPGYGELRSNGTRAPGTWREWWARVYPHLEMPDRIRIFPPGWSRTNLYRKKPSDAALELKHRGWGAAKRYLPHVMRDMSQLRFLELIIIDDFETDVMIQARNPSTGRYEIVPCKGLLAIDGATRRILAWALKPKFSKSKEEQEETGAKKHGLTMADVKQLLFSVFNSHGLPRDYGCTILCENATASIDKDFELSLESLFHVQVARTGLMAREAKTLKNGFGQGGGKPFEKGWIESMFNLVWNKAGALPGQKGSSYHVKPADTLAKVLYAMGVLKIEGLTDEQVHQLHLPFFKFDELLDAFDKIFKAIENRTQHAMQGFDEVVEYLLPDGTDIVSRERVIEIGLKAEEVGGLKCVPRMESSIERFVKITAGVPFMKVREEALALLLLTPKPVELRNHKITFTAFGKKGFTFFDADSDVMKLPEGTKLIGYMDGEHAAVLHCTNQKGEYVGSIRRQGRVNICDQAAISLQAGEVTRIISRVHNDVRRLCADEDAQLGADKDFTRAKLAEFGVPEKLLPPGAAPAPEEKKSAAVAEKPAGVSAKLGRKSLSRDAFAVHQQALVTGIAAEGKRIAADVALSNSDGINPDDIL